MQQDANTNSELGVSFVEKKNTIWADVDVFPAPGSTATRIWGESGPCLKSCVWHLHLVLVPAGKQRAGQLNQPPACRTDDWLNAANLPDAEGLEAAHTHSATSQLWDRLQWNAAAYFVVQMQPKEENKASRTKRERSRLWAADERDTQKY